MTNVTVEAALVELYKVQEEMKRQDCKVTDNMRYTLDDAITILNEISWR